MAASAGGGDEGRFTVERALDLCREQSAAEKLRVAENLIQEVRAGLPQPEPETWARGAAAPSPEEIQQMRDEIFHDF